MDQTTTTRQFYDQESVTYSNKRYKGLIDSYIKYFFRRRLAIVTALTKQAIKKQDHLVLLEIACADGVVLRHLDKSFPDSFSRLTGIDIAPKMIEVALVASNQSNKYSYYVRGEEPTGQFDVILSIGYLAPSLFATEFPYVKERLKPGGYYLCSQAGRFSIQAWLKIRHQPYYRDYLSYRQIEKRLAKDFRLVTKMQLGLYVPKLWYFPHFAQRVQPIIDQIISWGGPLTQELFHETVYLLQKNTN